jgi:hypothetical protein
MSSFPYSSLVRFPLNSKSANIHSYEWKFLFIHQLLIAVISIFPTFYYIRIGEINTYLSEKSDNKFLF